MKLLFLHCALFSLVSLCYSGQYFVMMSPSDVTSSSAMSQRSVSRLPLCSRPAVVSNIVRDDRRRQTHKEGKTKSWDLTTVELVRMESF